MELTAARLRAKDIACIAAFTALMAVCSWITVPMPTRIDFTLQTLGVFLAAGVLGGRRGTLAVAAYLLLGAAGAPVFAGFTGGLGMLLTPSGGYLAGFFFSALVMWGAERLLGERLWALGLGMAAGLLVCYAFGTAWFLAVYPAGDGPVGLWTALAWCVFPYVPFDLAKLAVALGLAARLRRHVR